MSASPTIDCYRTIEGSQLTFFCPNCLLWHYHGGIRSEFQPFWRRGEADGHRAPHCDGEHKLPQLYRTGYVLREVGIITAEIVRSFKCRWGRAATKPSTRVVDRSGCFYPQDPSDPSFTKKAWGDWRYEARTRELVHKPSGYAVDLQKPTSAGLLDWIFQVHNKTWGMEAEHDFLNALEDILNPQAAMCSFGIEEAKTA